MSSTTLKAKPPLANKLQQPKVQIRLDGRDWPIVVTHNILCDLEELTGLNVLTGADTSMAKPSATMIRALLFLCLREQGAEYTIEEVGRLITRQNLVLVSRGLIAAYAASMPRKEEVEADEADPIEAVG